MDKIIISDEPHYLSAQGERKERTEKPDERIQRLLIEQRLGSDVMFFRMQLQRNNLDPAGMNDETLGQHLATFNTMYRVHSNSDKDD